MNPETIVAQLNDHETRLQKVEGVSSTASGIDVVDVITKRLDTLQSQLDSLRAVVGVPEHGTLTDAEAAVNAATANASTAPTT